MDTHQPPIVQRVIRANPGDEVFITTQDGRQHRWRVPGNAAMNGEITVTVLPFQGDGPVGIGVNGGPMAYPGESSGGTGLK